MITCRFKRDGKISWSTSDNSLTYFFNPIKILDTSCSFYAKNDVYILFQLNQHIWSSWQSILSKFRGLVALGLEGKGHVSMHRTRFHYIAQALFHARRTRIVLSWSSHIKTSSGGYFLSSNWQSNWQRRRPSFLLQHVPKLGAQWKFILRPLLLLSHARIFVLWVRRCL